MPELRYAPQGPSEGRWNEADGTLTAEYCSYCYVGGKFVNPDMTMAEMRALVIEKLREKGYPKIVARFFASGLGRLSRWR